MGAFASGARSPASWTISAVLALFGAAGCATLAEESRPVASAVGEALLSDEEAAQLGNQLAAKVKSEEKVLNAPAVQEYVQSVGQRVLASIPEQERQYTYEFTVLDAPDTVNAFALPGGHVFVESGLLKAVDSEAELAAVLGHEIAHVTQGHAKQSLATQYGVQTLQEIALGKNPGALAQLASTVVSQGYLSAYSRESESEADTVGLGYLAQAGYDPQAMPAFFEKLAKLHDQPNDPVSQFVASHPDPGARAQATRALIAQRHLGGGREAIVGDVRTVQAQLPGSGPAIGGGPAVP